MFKRLGAVLLAMFLRLAAGAQATTVETVPEGDIGRIVREIDPVHIERTIRILVSFGTRNTLSAQDDPKRGIGAARDWLYGEMMQLREASEGRLRVDKQTFTQPAAPRIPRPTPLTNIVAILPGDLP